MPHTHQQGSGARPNGGEIQSEHRKHEQGSQGPHYRGDHAVDDEALPFIQRRKSLSPTQGPTQNAEGNAGQNEYTYHLHQVEDGEDVVA